MIAGNVAPAPVRSAFTDVAAGEAAAAVSLAFPDSPPQETSAEAASRTMRCLTAILHRGSELPQLGRRCAVRAPKLAGLCNSRVTMARSASGARRPARPLRFHAITEAAHRFDEASGHAEFLPETLHMHVDGARLQIGCGSPHGLEQLEPMLHPAAPLGEQQEKLVLGRREVDVLAIDGDAVRAAIDAQRRDEHEIGGLAAAPRATKDGPDAQDQLTGT